MALVAEEAAAAAAWPGFVRLHYCQTFHSVSVGKTVKKTNKHWYCSKVVFLVKLLIMLLSS